MSNRTVRAAFVSLCVFAALLAACTNSKPIIGGNAILPSPEAMVEYSMIASPPSGRAPSAMPSPGFQPSLSSAQFNTEEYDRIVDNPFLKALDNPVSTFSIDVDTASYANLRRFLMESRSMPPKDAVRIEEMVNYFTYEYPSPGGDHPVGTDFTLAPAPWAADHQLLRVALKAKNIDTASLPASNLIFLIDVSGSMAEDNKLPLLKDSLKILVDNLRPQDRVSIVTYASTTGVALDSTPGSKKEAIGAAVARLEAGGSTAGGAGIQLAYNVAKASFIKGGNNRVILCTDGDFNVGVSSTADLERMIEEKRAEGIFLTVLGFGMGNYKDSRLETLADKGNGSYAYIDNLLEGKKVLGKELWGNLYVVAKDVKIQIEFNPATVREYRLIGYENRLLAREDFNDDTKDAGEMGAGQTVTAFYEIVPQTAPSVSGPAPDPLAFQQSTVLPSDDLFVFKLRYKDPGDAKEESRLITARMDEKSIWRELAALDDDFSFASAVVEFGMLLRESPYKGRAGWASAMERARASKGTDHEGYRAEFIKLVEMAELLEKN
ncbi:MAG: VWA domain-containing protein [Rectinemataceae bacterium]|nr:VWA domain-containing protein [Rectinemataceae bacterium]